jgi:carbon-monoxide dehydrogenase medium subunit/xanthine dehydrogenase FAD-binding subunit
MQRFSYLSPKTLGEALAAMHEHAGHIRPLAGGTDLMIELRNELQAFPGMDFALDLTRVGELTGISEENGLVRIGSMATHDAVSRSPLVHAAADMLAQACFSVGAQQIRNVATIGGNICNAAVAADTLSPLAALDACVTLQSVSGTRELPLTEFVTGAGKTAIHPDELLVRLAFRPLTAWRTVFVKLGRRKALAISRINAAVALRFENGKIADARISPGCVFASPRRVSSAEQLLLGCAPSEKLFERCGKAVSEEMIKITGVRWSTEYKYPALSAVVSRALCIAAGVTEEEA